MINIIFNKLLIYKVIYNKYIKYINIRNNHFIIFIINLIKIKYNNGKAVEDCFKTSKSQERPQKSVNLQN